MTVMYEFFEHTADLGLRIRAADVNTLFVEAAQALFAAVVEDLSTVRPEREIRVELPAEEVDYLLFDWLSELLYTFETEHLLFSRFDVQVDAVGLSAVCRGEPIDPARHKLEHEVKAITYHELNVRREENGWLAEVIVDI